MPAPIRHQGGVALFYLESPAFEVEAIRQFGANVIVCQLVTGERRWYIFGCYLAPGDGTMIRYVEALMEYRPIGNELIVVGDLNVELKKAGDQGRDREIAAAVMTEGLEDITGHFFPRRRAWCRDRRTWEVVRQGRVVRSWEEYILVSDREIFQNVAIRDPRHNSDYLMVVGCLRGASRWNTLVTSGAGRAFRYVRPAVRRGRGWTSFSLSC